MRITYLHAIRHRAPFLMYTIFSLTKAFAGSGGIITQPGFLGFKSFSVPAKTILSSLLSVIQKEHAGYLPACSFF